MKILHNTTTIGKTSFGIGQISVSLAQAQLELGNNVQLWCLDNKENIKWAAKTHSFPEENISGFKLFGPGSLWFSPHENRWAKKIQCDLFDIVHQHGIWTGASSGTLILSKRKRLPAIIAPHGSLNKWVLNRSPLKKKIAMVAYEHSNLSLASCLHATSENEIADFRDFGLKNPIAFIENGIQKKYLTQFGNEKRFRVQNDLVTDERILLFLSRISPKKGLIMLVEAINLIKSDFGNWKLIIAGIDEFDHKKEVESKIIELGLETKIKIIGPLFDQEKNDAFSAAELFILPSHSEGSPMVVLDSLAAGVPVITTKASSWSDLNQHHCGWWTDISIPAIAVALREAVNKSSTDLHKMGDLSKTLIDMKYTWPQLAKKTIRLYNWVLGFDDKPDFVQLD